MKKLINSALILLSIMSLLLTFVGCDIPRNIPTDERFNESGWIEIFRDDFDGDRLDTRRWRYFTGDRYGASNPRHIHRGSYYSSEEDIVYVKDGKLTIATKYKENGIYGTGWYSSWIETTTGIKGRAFEEKPKDYVGFSQKYGYFEIRCIAPPAEGLWSAFWLLPDEGIGLTPQDEQYTARDGAEVDIMESQNYFRNKPYVQHVVHADYGVRNGLKSDKSPIYKVPNMYSEFHTYGVEWSEENMTFYIDGYKTYSTPVVYKDTIMGTPDVVESLILSVEVAGYSDEDGTIHTGYEKDGSTSWLGNLDNMDKNHSYDFVIDYVRVMQKKPL